MNARAPLWACLHLRAPALAAVRRRLAEPPGLLAICDGPQTRSFVLACSAAAAMAGVRPGQSLPAARALCPALRVLPRDPAAERELRELLGQWAYGYSDQVSLDLPDAVALEVGGSLKLFRGWPRLERCLRDDLARLGLEAGLALAPRPRAAWLLAQRHNGQVVTDEVQLRRQLDAVPIVEAGLPAGATASLRAMGFLCLRELAALPRDGLGRRIGPEALAHLDRLYGRLPDPLPHWQPPARFESVLEFDARPTAVEPLLFALRRLLGELVLVLQARDGGVQQFRLLLLHEDRPVTPVPVGLLRPERDPARLLELARARLERVVLPAPVAGLGLVADRLPPFRPAIADLFTQARTETSDWTLLLERLRARLGDEAVLEPVATADHRPECAGTLRVLHHASAPAARPRAGAAPVHGHARQLAETRPVWLLPRPVPLRQPPARILAGPERLESGWWDGGDVRRDYYVVETRDGQRAWVYCPPGRRDGWMLHGWFA